MKILVCVKQVPATDSRIKPAGDGKAVDPTGVEFVVNPYDEFAVEEALRIKEKLGGEVVAVGIGGAKAEEGLRTCLALGCDRALVLKDESYVGGEAMTTAKALAAIVKSQSPDLVLMGKQAVDDDLMAVPSMVAELLGWPQATVVVKLDIAADGKSAVAQREIEGAVEVVQLSLPAVIAAQKGLNEPRYASLKGIMAAKKIAIDVKTPSDLGLDEGDVYKQRVVVVSLELPAEKSGGRKIDGSDPAAAAAEILKYIKDEVKAL